jgi:thiol:disulfide interchange protein DsbC
MKILSIVSVAVIATLGLTAAVSAAEPANSADVKGDTKGDIRGELAKKIPGAKAEDVVASPVPGLYEISVGGVTGYITADGKYLVMGDLYELASRTNITEARRATARIKEVNAIKDADTIVFGPKGPVRHTITIFTDVDCGYCRKLHGEMAEYNKLGIRVRYAAYPRSGPGTESWTKMESVWCATDRRDALTRAKQGETPKPMKCSSNIVANQFKLGEKLGVNGTPAIMTEDGDYIGGYLPPEKLIAHLEELKVAALANKAAAK